MDQQSQMGHHLHQHQHCRYQTCARNGEFRTQILAARALKIAEVARADDVGFHVVVERLQLRIDNCSTT